MRPGDKIRLDFNDYSVKGNIDSIDQNKKRIIIDLGTAEDFEVVEAKYQGKNVKLNDPSYDKENSKRKFKVYVKHPKTGNIVKVGFGDPKMEIKRDDPDRRRSFRARHKCDTVNFDKDRHTARYWSCRMWEPGKSVSDIISESKNMDIKKIKQIFESKQKEMSEDIIDFPNKGMNQQDIKELVDFKQKVAQVNGLLNELLDTLDDQEMHANMSEEPDEKEQKLYSDMINVLNKVIRTTYKDLQARKMTDFNTRDIN